MPSVLLTAFEPYDHWPENASWLALVELTRELSSSQKLVTRRYPVDFDSARMRLEEDLAANYDYVLHLGQAPGISRIYLEAIGVNVGGHSSQTPDEYQPLVVGGPPAYQSSLPLAHWSSLIRALGIPCQVSHHAGTYLCNALLYLTHHIARERGLRTRCTFIHLPPCAPAGAERTPRLADAADRAVRASDSMHLARVRRAYCLARTSARGLFLRRRGPDGF